MADKFADTAPRFSPDGRWLAYSTNETGRSEIFVIAYPGPGGKWRVSTSGGYAPAWRADGKELFFRDPDGGICAVSIRAEAGGIDPGAPVKLFSFDAPNAGPTRNRWDVSADGQRFLVNSLLNGSNAAGEADVILGWDPKSRRR